MKKSDDTTSWNKIGKWYDDIVGEQGHYYHQNIIIPNIFKLFDFPSLTSPSLLDLACGQGILSRHLQPNIKYTGVDIAPNLIKAARQYSKNPNHEFITADVTKNIPTVNKEFSCASIILALQNIENPLAVFENARKHLISQGKFLIVLNHPCFRIPRQSSWKTDTENKIQFRRIDRYMSSMKIPIQTNPGQGKNSSETWSFHHPLSSYCNWLNKAGFTITRLEEWCSDKVSEGKAAKMENRSREEFPLFMAILATKVS